MGVMRFCLFFCLAFFSSTAFGQPAPPIAISDFAALPTVENPRLSPNGKMIAARSVVDSKHFLVLIDADNPAAQRRIAMGEPKISAIHWAGNDRLLIEILAETKFAHQEYMFGRMIVFDLKTEHAIFADPNSHGLYGGDVLYVSDDGTNAIVASQDDVFSYPSVKRIDLATGKANVIERAKTGVWDWYVDGKGVVRGGVTYDESRWKVWYRSKEGEPFRTVKGKFDKDDTAVDRFYFSDEGDAGTIITNEKTGRFGVYRYNFNTGEIGETIFEHPEVDVDEVIFEKGTRQILGIRYQDTRWRTHWLDPKMTKLQERIDRALPKYDNRILGDPDSDARMLVWSGSASEPGIYFLYDQAKSTMSPVLSPLNRIDAGQLADVEPIRYKARDGLMIQGYLTLPKGREAKALPLILLPHGGPFARDDWSYDPIVQFLANHGYAVLQPEFRGSTGYGKEFVERGYGEWGRKMQDDLDDGVDWLASTGKIDPKRVCIVGGSYGGYAALWGVIRNPERYRCAASMAGVTDLEAQLSSNRKSFSATRYFRQWRTKVQGAGKFDLKTVSPLYQSARLTRPVLLVHGEKDEVVPVKQGKAMVEAMQKANADYVANFYKDGGHDFSNSKDMTDFFTRLDAFLAKHNPVG